MIRLQKKKFIEYFAVVYNPIITLIAHTISTLAMVLRSPPPTSLVLLTTLLLLLIPSPSTADENNLLLTGESLPTDGQLSNSAATFVMQYDCNLVLYNKANVRWQSHTHDTYLNCTVTLNNRGQLVIHNNLALNFAFPASPNPKVGNYAAVLRPDGQLAIYGPAVWSTPANCRNTNNCVSPELMVTNKPMVNHVPLVNNMLFSNQMLSDGSKLTTRGYTFLMRADCELVLGGTWAAGTAGKGRHCFARLDHRGELSVLEDGYKKLWRSNSTRGGDNGDYVLVLQTNGQAVIYGPIVWSTASG